MNTQTIDQRIMEMRAQHGLSRVQLFVEDRTLTLQMVELDNGAKGCEWKPERGESMHDALDECHAMLIDQLIAKD